MKLTMKSKQRGISFLGLVIVGAILAFAGVIGAQVAPTVIEFQAIKKAANKAAAEGNTVADVRRIYGAASAIDDFKSVTPNDLEVVKQGDKIVVSFAYNKEIHLGGPAFLLLKYTGTTAK
jgi:beta-lactam-binding protein with PASTA domain